MLKTLNTYELNLVAGGESCPAEHNGQPFTKAEFWHDVEGGRGAVSFISCFYGEGITSPAQIFKYAKVTNYKHWYYYSSTQLYTITECTCSAVDCEFILKK